MSATFKLIDGIVGFLQDGNKAAVVTGDVKSGLIVLRFKNGIEWRTNIEDRDFIKSLKPEAFVTGTSWEFDGDGNFVKVHYPEKSQPRQGRASGSSKQMPIST